MLFSFLFLTLENIKSFGNVTRLPALNFFQLQGSVVMENAWVRVELVRGGLVRSLVHKASGRYLSHFVYRVHLSSSTSVNLRTRLRCEAESV